MIKLLIENSFQLACSFGLIGLVIVIIISSSSIDKDSDSISDGLKTKLALDSDEHDDQLKKLVYNQHILEARLEKVERKAGVPDTPKPILLIVRGDDDWQK